MPREASRVLPPPGLRVNRQSAVPVHAQLHMQIQHLIGTGALEVLRDLLAEAGETAPGLREARR